MDRSPAGYTHVAGNSGPVVPTVDDEAMAARLAVDGIANRRLERLISLGLAQRRAQIRGILLTETHI